MDFTTAFLKGIDNAKDAEIGEVEVQKVLTRINVALAEITHGQLAIGIRFPRQEQVDIVNTEGKALRLCSWGQQYKGFPCEIGWDYHLHICEDVEALERVFGELLQEAETGRKIRSLMQTDLETINKNSARLNVEAEDTLDYQEGC